ncbi:uncharacterized protein LOC129224809 [Uloborus diversus]|uniref:uncharacterized protein LOC129224809 n=1 Tax=Uloborus diversus TaxID=327109 RepID=UPI002408F723|nr:uncharacterized protein LOC129224809 [Uloborus diversus]
MDEPQPGPSNIQLPIIQQETSKPEDDIPFADSPESPRAPQVPTIDLRKASIAAAQQHLHDGIILLITSDNDNQRSPNGSLSQHQLSEFYLLPLPQDALGANRRYSLQDRPGKDHHKERKASCPDTELRLSPDRSNSGRRSSSCYHDLDIPRDRLTPTSRRSSNASACGSRRSSNCSIAGGGHRRRSSNCTSCSRRSSGSSVSHSRRSSTASHRSSPPSHGSRRSSNCSRRSSNCHFDSDEEVAILQQPHHHHHHHRGSRSSLEPGALMVHGHRESSASMIGGGARRGSHRPPKEKEEEPEEEGIDEREELEMGGIPLRHRRIIIMIIGSVSIFILVMSVVLIAVSLTLSPTIDDLVLQRRRERILNRQVFCDEISLNTSVFCTGLEEVVLSFPMSNKK